MNRTQKQETWHKKANLVVCFAVLCGLVFICHCVFSECKCPKMHFHSAAMYLLEIAELKKTLQMFYI